MRGGCMIEELELEDWEQRHGLMVMQAAPVTYKNTWRGWICALGGGWEEAGAAQYSAGRRRTGMVQEWQQKMTR